MSYPGKAYRNADVMPGDYVKAYSRTGFVLNRYPNGAVVLHPDEVEPRGFTLKVDPDHWVYLMAPDEDPNSIDGWSCPGDGSGVRLVVTDRRDQGSSSHTSELKEQNDRGGCNGKCMQCDRELKAWTPGRFYCPTCEP
jgi:hypothetical protein